MQPFPKSTPGHPELTNFSRSSKTRNRAGTSFLTKRAVESFKTFSQKLKPLCIYFEQGELLLCCLFCSSFPKLKTPVVKFVHLPCSYMKADSENSCCYRLYLATGKSTRSLKFHQTRNKKVLFGLVVSQLLHATETADNFRSFGCPVARA